MWNFLTKLNEVTKRLMIMDIYLVFHLNPIVILEPSMIAVYGRKGVVGRYNDHSYTSPYYALFKRESEYVTYVTVARNTWKYHETTIHARILTFNVDKIGYILNMDIIDTWYPEYIHTQHGCHEDHAYLLSIMRPSGIEELRFWDGPKCLEVFQLTKKVFTNILHKPAMISVFVDHLKLNYDVADIIYENTHDNFEELKLSQFIKPFKVQGLNHGSKKPNYKVVTKDQDEEDGWSDLSEVETDFTSGVSDVEN